VPSRVDRGERRPHARRVADRALLDVDEVAAAASVEATGELALLLGDLQGDAVAVAEGLVGAEAGLDRHLFPFEGPA